jgi:hypothetical protein
MATITEEPSEILQPSGEEVPKLPTEVSAEPDAPVDTESTNAAVAASDEVEEAKAVEPETPQESTDTAPVPTQDVEESPAPTEEAAPEMEPNVGDPPVEIPVPAATSTEKAPAPTAEAAGELEIPTPVAASTEGSAVPVDTSTDQKADVEKQPDPEVSVPSPEPVSDLAGDLKAFTGDLQTAVDSFLAGEQEGSAGLGGRKKIIAAAEKILGVVKDPGSQWMERSVQIGNIGAAHLFQVWGAFEQIPEEGSISFAELAEKLDAETSVVGKFRRLRPHIGCSSIY